MSNLSEDPTEWGVKTWLLILGLSSLGGVANWIRRRKIGARLSIMELIGEVTTSASVGITVFMLMTSLSYPLLACVAGSSVAGHFATRILFAVQHLIDAIEEKKLKEIFKNDD